MVHDSARRFPWPPASDLLEACGGISELALDSATKFRLFGFAGVFIVMAVWELFAPRRAQSVGRARRWPNNLGAAILNLAVVRVLIPIAAIDIAGLGELQGWGLFNNLPRQIDPYLPWAVIIPSIILLDLTIYLQHVVLHAVPALWRLHRMHHTDLDIDVTTGVRFHPGEIAISAIVKLGAVAAIGPPPQAVLIFEILLNGTSMFNHSNAYMPPAIDRVLRWLVVTPDMHRVHHSIIRAETDSNFGFNFPWWDRWFGTYRAQPAAGHLGMTIGITEFREPKELRLDRMLVQPWRGGVGSYPIGRD